ncbi:MAG TPA: ectonucleotide pyrophosphatase/phosphodiesterase [Burkholderiaceae bacterium]|nr:ectonucleotide pyrophosphatase/phosphodiesterase [Burkholderiaceae bacterium]
MSFRRLACLLLLACVWLCGPAHAQSQPPHVLMVSFDGFRHDYVQRFIAQGGKLPNFQRLLEEGASADSMIPAYPSSTFPNHYTLVTGLYPGHHGLVNNSFFSRRLGLGYSMGNLERVRDARFYGGVPLWQYVQRQGLKAAAYFWVGSEAPVAGEFPDYYFPYDEGRPDEERVATVLSWLALPQNERPRFISLYFSFMDHVGHEFGPDSFEVAAALPHADALLGSLLDGLEASDLPVDLIVVSDHGMYPITANDESVILTSSLDIPEGVKASVSSTLVQLYVDDAALLSDTYAALKARARHFNVYLKEETPEHWHYREHPDTGEILLEAEPGHLFSNRPQSGSIGVHGYDPTVPEMQAIFYAWGPDIRAGTRVPAFENVDVFPLVIHLLGLPEANGIDGRLEPLLPLLKD